MKSLRTRRTRSTAVMGFRPSTLPTPARHVHERFHPCSHADGRCGVTLVELLLVLSLLVVLTAISLPAVLRWQRSLPLEQTISLLQFQLQETRVAAIRSGEAWCLVLPSTNSPGRRHPLDEPETIASRSQFRLPDEIRCEVIGRTSSHPTTNSSDSGRIVFHADGTVEQSRIRITTNDGSITTLDVNRLTGTTRIVQLQAKARYLTSASHNHPGACL